MTSAFQQKINSWIVSESPANVPVPHSPIMENNNIDAVSVSLCNKSNMRRVTNREQEVKIYKYYIAFGKLPSLYAYYYTSELVHALGNACKWLITSKMTGNQSRLQAFDMVES